jgi:Mrp family chromosome partitioning ATPase
MDEQNRNLVEVASAAHRPDRWSALAAFEPNLRRMGQRRIVTIRQTDPAHLAFDMLRTRTMMALRAKTWSTLAITSPTPGCGKGTIALNLAVSLARQHDIRVVLVDLDLRRPRIAAILGLDNAFSTESFLQGGCRIEDFFVRYGNSLAIGASRQAVAQPAELLHDQRSVWALRGLRQGLLPNLVVYNMPPMLTADDFLGFLPHLDCAVLVVGADYSRVTDIDQCERELNEAGKLLGVVLNKCRYTDERYSVY